MDVEMPQKKYFAAKLIYFTEEYRIKCGKFKKEQPRYQGLFRIYCIEEKSNNDAAQKKQHIFPLVRVVFTKIIS